MKTLIDQNNWPRKEIFDFYTHTSYPFYVVSFRQDVTKLYDYTKSKKISFYYALSYLVTQAINEVEAFHYVIEDQQVYYLDKRYPSFTDLKKGEELFHITTIVEDYSLDEFCLQAKKVSEQQTFFLDYQQELDNLVYISCLPWMDITTITNERNMADPKMADDTIPRVAWGKYVESNGKKELGISIEVNHRVVDGYALGKFVKKLTALIENLDS